MDVNKINRRSAIPTVILPLKLVFSGEVSLYRWSPV